MMSLSVLGTSTEAALADGYTQALISLRGTSDVYEHVRLIVDLVCSFALDLPAVVTFAEAEINEVCGAGRDGKGREGGYGITRQWAIGRLHPVIHTSATAHEKFPHVRKVAPFDSLTAWGDANELRITRALYSDEAAMVLAAIRHLNSTSGGSGSVKQKAVVAFLHGKGLTATAATIHRYILRFNGILWTYDASRKNIHVRATAHRRRGVTKGLLNITELAQLAGRDDLIQSDFVGTQMVPLRFGKTARVFTAYLYRGWLASRSDPKANLGRVSICTAWGVKDAKTVRGWEKIAHIKAIPVFAELPDASPHLTPEWAQRAVPIAIVKDGETTPSRAWRVRWSNRYQFRIDKKRQQIQLPRERRRAAIATLELIAGRDTPNTLCADARAAMRGRFGQGSHPKINFFDRGQGAKFTTANQQIADVLSESDDYRLPRTANMGMDTRYGSEVVVINDGRPLGKQLVWWQERQWFAANNGYGIAVAELRGRAP